jgi:lipopolysaccharide transport system permease protein
MNKEWIQELWRFRELFYFLAWRDVKIRYKQTVLGVAWAVLQPLLTMAIFLVLFGKIANIPTDGIPPALFYYAGLVPWMYFSTALGMAANSLVSNSNLLTKVYFPRSVLPAGSVLGGLVDFAIGGLLLGGFLVYYQVPLRWNLLLWPLLTLLLVMITYGLGLFLSALTVKYRDVKYIVPFVVQLGLFVTPVIYPVSAMPARYRHLLALNPLTGIIDGYRIALADRTPDWATLGISVFTSILVLAIGALYFSKVEKSFADLV